MASRVSAMCSRWAAQAKTTTSSSTSSLAGYTTFRSFGTGNTKDVGILAMEMYVPQRYVSQEKLETFDKVSAGKYTVGLGQKNMAFVDDREDINSIALTAVQRLLENYKIDPKSIGRLDVGTESLVDKSKSSKTVLMELFKASGNRDIEGATVMNACYGGTASLFNSAAWIESSEWDGRYAIYVAADIAVYEAGPARPTGGCGAVAALIGPNAPLALIPRTRTTHSVNVYDFYKPNLSSEYPAVDGKLSQVCYLQAVDDCYNGTMDKLGKIHSLYGPNKSPITLPAAFDNIVFHSPYNKLVQQSFRRMLYNDARRLKAAGTPLPTSLASLDPFTTLAQKDTYSNKDLDKALSAIGGDDYKRMVGPSIELSQQIGNSYTAAVHNNILCLVDSQSNNLEGKRIGAFSYGSGAIATMFGLAGRAGNPNGFSLSRIASTVGLKNRLASRREATPEEFTAALGMREAGYGKSSFTPQGSIDNVPSGAYYLKEVGKNHNRIYERKA